MNLCNAILGQLPATVAAPAYARAALTPGIVHIGCGNFHRAHMAVYLDDLFGRGKSHDWGILGAGVRAGDAVMRDALAAQDWLFTVTEVAPDVQSARAVGSMVGFVPVDAGNAALIAAMRDPAIRIVSLTVTEGGYFIDPLTGSFNPDAPEIIRDAANPDAPDTAFGAIIAALKARRAAGVPAFTVMCCDNVPHNGAVTRNAVVGLAHLSDPALAAWISANVAFPNSMVDRITPATGPRERAMIAGLGVQDAAPVTCEPFRQWVLEDHFPTGRPALEQVGVEFVTDVAPYELMKLRILNGGHAAIAYPSALLGHHFVHDAMADPLIRDWLVKLIEREAIGTLAPLPGVDYHAYLAQVAARFANPKVADTIARLCLDGSNRQPKFILPVIRDALARGLPVEGLALEVALWCRYCAGTDESGAEIPPNDESAADLKVRALDAKTDPARFIGNARVFGGLSADPVFASAFARYLADLWQHGTRAVLARFVSGDGPTI